MRNKVVVILVCTLMASGFLATTAISGNDLVLQKKQISLFDAEDGVISVGIPVGEYAIKETDVGYEVSVEGFGHRLVSGKPILPSKIFSIAIPPGAEFVDLSFESNDGIILPGYYYIAPCEAPDVIGVENPIVQQKEEQTYESNYESVYTSDEPYPASVVEFVSTAGYRKYNLVDVRVMPFTYHPASGSLVYYPDIDVHVSYTFPEGYSDDDVMVDDIPEAEKLAEKTILNYNQAKNWYPSGPKNRASYDYVIITLDSLTDYITDLVNWEETKGRTVYVATTDWIDGNYNGYDLAEKMRNFLRDKYPEEEWGILDACLIGHYDDVPMRLTAQNTGYGQPETDYYYAELSLPDSESWDKDGDHQWGESSDPIDFHAEINVGRIPWSDPETVEHICEKSVAYEEADDPAFKKNILLIGTFFWPDTDNAVLMEIKTDPEDHPWMEDWTMTRMYEEQQSQYECDYDVSYDTVKEVWSEGTYAFVDWAGHGSPTACYEYYPQQPFVDTDTCNYLNDDYPAIIFADACSNSDTSEDNIGQMMLEQGGIGFLGATKVAYGFHGWDDPYDGTSESLDYFFTTCCTSGSYTQGQAHQYALLEMYLNDLWYYQYYETFEWGALWGNPDLTMAEVVTSDPPEIPDAPDGPEQWIIDVECTFYADTTDPNGDQIYYMWDWGDGNISDWIGPYNSGEVGSANHTWIQLGDYEIKVKAQDEFGAKSNWSLATPLSIVEDEAPYIPEITGKELILGGMKHDYTFVADDPEGHDVYYHVDWDDGHATGWLGPYGSGEPITLEHAW